MGTYQSIIIIEILNDANYYKYRKMHNLFSHSYKIKIEIKMNLKIFVLPLINVFKMQ